MRFIYDRSQVTTEKALMVSVGDLRDLVQASNIPDDGQFEGVEVAHAMAAKTPVKARACGLRAKKFAGDGQQIIQGQQQHLSQFDHDLFLCRCERGLKPVRGVRSVMEAVSPLPLVDRALAHPIALGQSCCGVRAGRDFRTNGWRGACVLVQRDHHDKAPGWTAEVTPRLSTSCRMTSLAMNNG